MSTRDNALSAAPIMAAFLCGLVATGGALSARQGPPGDRNIWQQPLNGSAPAPVTHFTDQGISNYGWSADGKTLAVARTDWDSNVILVPGRGHRP